jgi:galactokinase
MDNNSVKQLMSYDKNILKRIKNLQQVCQDVFGKDKNSDKQNLTATYAPGRAEIIGNHTDYNEGYTISTNISQNLLMIGKPNDSNKVEVLSLNEDRKVYSFFVSSPDAMVKQRSKSQASHSWTNYIKGVLWAFAKRKIPLKGFRAVIQSTIPLGGGVSSSAALELATAHFLCALGNQDIRKETLISMCKYAENKYVGAPCGYLDQATVELADSSMLFISYRQVGNSPFSWDTIDINLQDHGLTFIIGYDLSSKHSIVEGKYKVRQKACKQSIPILEKVLVRKLQALRDVSLGEFKKLDTNIFANTPIPYKWILHVISENQRVLEAKDKIKQADMQGFGDLLTASGKSAIYDYQLAEDTPELIWLYETILKNKKAWGVIGTRNMGGGFNATTLSLVKSDNARVFKTSLQEFYSKKFNSHYHFLEFSPAPSAGQLFV